MKKIVQVLLFLLLLVVPLHAQQQDSTPPDSVKRDTTTQIKYMVNLTPPGFSEYIPPPFYDMLWQDAMRCTGLRIPRAQTKEVHWFYVVADAFTLWDDHKTGFSGYTFFAVDQIVLILNGIDDHRLIKHEMVHYLMWRNGERAGHPDNYFKKCNLIRP